jgi:ABC-type transporter Mla subunit MlaD
MRRPLTWSKLLSGTIAIGSLLTAAIVVLLFARVGSLRGETYRLYVLADEARGVIKGTEVWLAGQKVGVVRSVTFRPVTADTLGRLVVALDILREYQQAIRHDSRVEFRAGATPIGATIVAMRVGSPGSAILEPGDTLARAPQIDPDSVRSQLSGAVEQLAALFSEVRTVSTGAQRNLANPSLAGERGSAVRTLTARLAELSARLQGTEGGRRAAGSLPRLLGDEEDLRAHATRVARLTDSLVRVVRGSEGTLPRIAGDTAFRRSLVDLRGRLAAARGMLSKERTAGRRLLDDSALVEQLRHAQSSLDSLLTDAARRPRRYLPF